MKAAFCLSLALTITVVYELFEEHLRKTDLIDGLSNKHGAQAFKRLVLVFKTEG